MITEVINTLFKGMVGIADKRVDEALNNGGGMVIWHDGNGMELSNMDLVSKRIAVSDRKFKDKYGGADYYLYYYKWKPTIEQGKMI